MKYLIINPFKNNYEPNGGSEIRIKGYTDFFTSSEPDYYFLSPVKPFYVPELNYVNFSLPRSFNKLLLLHNYFFHKPLFSFLSDLLNVIIKANRNIRILKNLSLNSVNIIHKEQNILLYLLLRFNKNFIYDIHGILNLQKEYSEHLAPLRKFWFKLNLANEIKLYKLLKYVNVVNNETLLFLKSDLSFKGKGFIAPDGLLMKPEEYIIDNNIVRDIRKKFSLDNFENIILFIGAFKKFGGVQFLTEAFIPLAKENKKLALFLIGAGQMESYIEKIIKVNNLENQIIHLREINYRDIRNYQNVADLIVIPDILSHYNNLTPHIKLYDALISRKCILVPGFRTNKKIISNSTFNKSVLFFEPSSMKSLQSGIVEALKKAKEEPGLDYNFLKSITYRNHGQELIMQYNKQFSGGDGI